LYKLRLRNAKFVISCLQALVVQQSDLDRRVRGERCSQQIPRALARLSHIIIRPNLYDIATELGCGRGLNLIHAAITRKGGAAAEQTSERRDHCDAGSHRCSPPDGDARSESLLRQG